MSANPNLVHFQHELFELGHAIYARPQCSCQVSKLIKLKIRYFKTLVLDIFVSFVTEYRYIFYQLAFASVRVSNELGAGHPRVAKFSVFVVNGTSILISIVFSAIVLIFRVELSQAFTSDSEVIEAVSDLTPLLAISVFLNGIQPILSGNHS